MYRIAIIQFPGSNCELEAARAVRRAGMEAEIWRWNRPGYELESFDGFIIPGGFSYEDRIRAGVIAAHDAVMEYVRQVAGEGKPVLGICNGAQILVEAGMVPGGRGIFRFPPRKLGSPPEAETVPIGPPVQKDPALSGLPQTVLVRKTKNPTAMSEVKINSHLAFEEEGGGDEVTAMLAVNKRTDKEGRLCGVGYYNEWVGIRSDLPRGRSAFTLAMDEGHHFRLPVAHGEGRFIFPSESMDQLMQNQQTLFRYCDAEGDVDEFFPTTPNGATYALAGVCNPEGNVLALMPHPERTTDGTVIFESIRMYLEEGRGVINHAPTEEAKQETDISPVQRELSQYFERPADDAAAFVLGSYIPEGIELLVKLIITDNTADTVAGVPAQRGMKDLRLRRFVHWEARVEGYMDMQEQDKESIALALIKAEEILNINKEIPFVRSEGQWYTYRERGLQETETPWTRDGTGEQIAVLVRDREDIVGARVLSQLRARFQFDALTGLRRGVVWVLEGREAREAYEYMLSENMFANPVGQEMLKFSIFNF